MINSFPLIRQVDVQDCGPSCLRMICAYFGQNLTRQRALSLCNKGQQGTSLFSIVKAAQELSFNTSARKLTLKCLHKVQLPCILHFTDDHYVVLYKLTRHKAFIADPRVGYCKLTHAELLERWEGSDSMGVACLLTPTIDFEKTVAFDNEHEANEAGYVNSGLQQIVYYLKRCKQFLVQLGLGALVLAVLNLVFPFLTQALVDHGIGNNDTSFIFLILVAQLVLFLSKTATEFIRGWIMVHMGMRVNVSVISDFLIKLMKLPIAYFSTRNMGDILQRIADHHKIEELLTSHSISVLFSLFNLIIFSVILAVYSFSIFCVFFVGSVISVAWVFPFMKRRRVLDHQHFAQLSSHQHAIVQLVYGMPEIKINQAEQHQKSHWERIQSSIFNNKLKTLAIEQYQQFGNQVLTEGKNIIITFLAASQVVSGDITMGMMMAIIYILGQMNAPMEQLIAFVHQFQNAKLSMERLGEIHQLPDEKNASQIKVLNGNSNNNIAFNNVSFSYPGSSGVLTLSGLTFNIPYKKTTAIVGASGSGKTTILKLLLKFFESDDGEIQVGLHNLKNVCPEYWRSKCGVVLQDGYIFNDTIAQNIALGHDCPDMERVIQAAQIANVHEEINSIDQGYNTKIGEEGRKLSGGQIQRILIARALYKNPEYLFFDEATSALDANNEKIIQNNLQYFFNGRTVVVVAHRLSTVMNADNIIVMDKGKIVEEGTHSKLTQQRGLYFSLVKNQLELGN